MKSKRFRTHDIDGVKYRFDSDAFSNAIRNCAGKWKLEKGSYTQHRLMEEMSEELNLTYDAIKKWKAGANGPGSIDIIKSLASFLNVDYLLLLMPEDKKEVISVVDSNVLEIFKECISSVFDFADKMCGEKDRNLKSSHRKEYFGRLDKIHSHIDEISLALPDDVVNKLHRIVIDLSEVGIGSTPSRWEDYYFSLNMSVDTTCITFGYMLYPTREEALKEFKEESITHIYMADEIDVATDLGFDDIVEAEDSDCYEDMDIDELMNYGYIGEEMNLTPLVVFKHMFRRVLSLVFKLDLELEM